MCAVRKTLKPTTPGRGLGLGLCLTISWVDAIGDLSAVARVLGGLYGSTLRRAFSQRRVL